jgi:hypothetical protein
MDSLTLYGEPGSLSFPALCPNCGRNANRNISYSKAFCRVSDLNSYVVSSVNVPFCDNCIAQHQLLAKPPSRLAKLVSSFSDADMIAALFYGAAAAFVGRLALADLLHGRWSHFSIEVLIAIVLGSIAWSQGCRSWRETEHLRIVPQTEITRAFDFDDHHRSVLEPNVFTCTIRDPQFARELKALNHSREWSHDSPRERIDRRRTQRQMWIYGAVMLAIAAAMQLLGWFK